MIITIPFSSGYSFTIRDIEIYLYNTTSESGHLHIKGKGRIISEPDIAVVDQDKDKQEVIYASRI